MREIVKKMERVDEEFQKRDLTIIALDERLSESKNTAQRFAQALRQAEKALGDKNQRINDLHHKLEQQRQLLDSQELKEFLQVENQTLTETLVDAEEELSKLKLLHEKKEDDLLKRFSTLRPIVEFVFDIKFFLFSEEQCRHLVRLNEQRHQEVLFVTARLKTWEQKAKDLIVKQVRLCANSKHSEFTLISIS